MSVMEILFDLQLDAHEIDGNDDPIVTSVYRTHQSKIEITTNVANRDMHTSFAVERSHRSIDTRKPQIRPHVCERSGDEGIPNTEAQRRIRDLLSSWS